MVDINFKKIYEEKKNSIFVFLLNFVVITAFFGGMLRRSYNADTTTYMVYTNDDMAVRIQDGRYLSALFDWIFYKIGIKTTDYMPICLFLSLVIFSVVATMLQHLYKEFFKSGNRMYEVAYYLATGMVFTNVLFIEYLMFPEVTLFYAVGFWLATLGVCYYTRGKRLLAFILILAGTCSYQITAIYAATALSFYYLLVHDFKFEKKTIVEELLAFLIPGSAALLNIVATNIVEAINSDYYFGKEYYSGDITDKILLALDSCFQFFKNSLTLLPNIYMPGIVFVVSLLIAVWLIGKKQGITGVVLYTLVIIACIAALLMSTMLEDGFHFPPRMAFSLYHVQGMMIISALVLLDNSAGQMAGSVRENLLKLVSVMVFAYIWVQMIFCSFIVSGRFVSNALDKTYAQTILREIDKYQERTGITVTKISVMNDEYAPPFYDESRNHYGQINERIIGQTTRTMFEAWFDRHFDEAGGVPEEVFEEHFKGKDWDMFDVSEQLVIVDDTAYLCVY